MLVNPPLIMVIQSRDYWINRIVKISLKTIEQVKYCSEKINKNNKI